MVERADIVALHRLYCELTGWDLPLRFDRERAWHEWIRVGNTPDDLRVVIRWIRAGIANAREQRDPTHRRNQGALRFSNLICQLDMWDEQLAAARAWAGPQRPPQPAPRTAAAQTPQGWSREEYKARIADLRRRLVERDFPAD